jgi:hypothetical protein
MRSYEWPPSESTTFVNLVGCSTAQKTASVARRAFNMAAQAAIFSRAVDSSAMPSVGSKSSSAIDHPQRYRAIAIADTLRR